MALIDREQALSHPFANGHYDKKHADLHFILGFEDYKEWLEDLPTIEAYTKDEVIAMFKDLKQDLIAEAYGIETDCADYVVAVADIDKVIQERIDVLRGNEDEP